MCPVCTEALVSYELEGVEIDSCLSCGGTWLDAGELERIAGVSEGALSEALLRGAGGKHGKRRCVRCRGTLRVVCVNGVELDRCPRGDGLWFDRNEMEAVIASFKDGEAGAVARFFGDLYKAGHPAKGG